MAQPGHPAPRRSAAMPDFASAAMLRVLDRGMRALGLDPGAGAPDTGAARVRLQLKQDLVQAAVRQGGLACLPLLGRGLHALTHEPTHQALASAHGARDLFTRWQRLERYIHSRHRCLIDHGADGAALIRHVAIGGGAAPSPAEDLVVVGVLAALLEAIGLQQVQAWAGDAPVFPAADASAIAAATARGTTGHWRFHWAAASMASTASTAGHRQPAPAQPAPDLDLGADRAWPDTVRMAYQRLAADLTRPLPLRDLAQALGLPPRTLQRRLNDAGLSYTRLLAEARCRAGAWRLQHTTDPIAEVGFLSGFADQSHFTRELLKRVGLTPAAYREAFADTAHA